MDKLNSVLENGDAFCVMPWVHMHITINGNVQPCCSSFSKPFGNINSNTIKEIWNGNEINEFRNNLINNIKDDRCKSCYFIEDSGSRSLRQKINKIYGKHFLEVSAIEKTAENGEAYPPIYWDIRLSNVCNFRCRTCNHGFSSRWFEDARKLSETTSTKPIIRALDDLETFYSQWEDFIDYVEAIYFAGGEPLMMEEHYRILGLLQAKNSYDTWLNYNTNFSNFTYKGMDVFHIWSKFKKVSVGASLDGWGKRGEFIRKEQKWDEVLKNRELMKEICPNVVFSVSVTVSVFNIFHIPDFHRELVAINFVAIDHFVIDNLLQSPKIYNIQILPLAFKLRIKEKFEKHMEWIDSEVEKNPTMVQNEHFRSQFTNCINYLFANDLSEYAPQFVSRCKKLDALRGEETIKVFPELEFMF